MKKILIIAISLALFCTACSTAWIATLDSILAAAAPALVNILQIVSIANGQPMNSNLATKINSDAGVIKTIAADFATASSGSAPGVCQQLQAAITVYQSDQQLVLQAAQVSDPNTQTKITLLADLVAGTVDAITAVIPSCQNANANRATTPSSSAHPAHSLSEFTERYNDILVTHTGNPAVDNATQKLKLYRHSKFLRAVTFGRLQ